MLFEVLKYQVLRDSSAGCGKVACALEPLAPVPFAELGKLRVNRPVILRTRSLMASSVGDA